MDDYILKRQKLQIFSPAKSWKWHSSELQNCQLCLSRRSEGVTNYIYFLIFYLSYIFILNIYSSYLLIHLCIIFRHPPSAVRRPPSTVRHLPSAVRFLAESCKLADFSSLKAILLGSVILKSEYKKAYQKEINRTWNAVIRTRQPCAFVRVASVEDVANTVKFCVHNKVG